MKEFAALLDRFWVTREENRELYYALKRAQPEYRQFVNERLGWNLFVNEAVVKLEKIPPKAAPWMGIASFQSPLDYCLLCALLLYLADLDDGAQFLLSSLTESVKACLSEVRPVDWTRFQDRRALVRVLLYAQETRLILVFDGASEGFGANQSQEALYENTGLSRHFPTHFGRDILRCQSVEDFEALAGEGADNRRQRVRRAYQQLALCPALYRSPQDGGEYDYVRNQRQTLERHLCEALGGELHVHKNGAFLVLEDGDSFGEVYPGRNPRRAQIDVMLILCAQIRAKVGEEYPREADDTVRLAREQFREEFLACRRQWAEGWGKEKREQSPDSLCQELIAEMSGWGLLKEDEDNLILLPAAAKWGGHYPSDFHAKEMEVGNDDALENAQVGISELLAL